MIVETISTIVRGPITVRLSIYRGSDLPARVDVTGDLSTFDESAHPEIREWLGDDAPLYFSEAEGEAPEMRGEGVGGEHYARLIEARAWLAKVESEAVPGSVHDDRRIDDARARVAQLSA